MLLRSAFNGSWIVIESSLWFISHIGQHQGFPRGSVLCRIMNMTFPAVSRHTLVCVSTKDGKSETPRRNLENSEGVASHTEEGDLNFSVLPIYCQQQILHTESRKEHRWKTKKKKPVIQRREGGGERARESERSQWHLALFYCLERFGTCRLRCHYCYWRCIVIMFIIFKLLPQLSTVYLRFPTRRRFFIPETMASLCQIFKENIRCVQLWSIFWGEGRFRLRGR